MIHRLTRIPRLLLIGVVRAYQLIVSPHFAPSCRFTPTCSEYAVEAFSKYGALKGLVLSIYRIARCHPWGGHGYDPPVWFGEARDRGPSEMQEADDPVVTGNRPNGETRMREDAPTPVPE